MALLSNAKIRSLKSIETVSIEGFAELDKILTERLPKGTSRAVLQRAGKTAFKPVLDRAQEKAPERTGETKASIRLIVKFLKAYGRFGAAVRIQVGVGSKDVFWPRFAERGTIHEPARPFMRPAFDEESRGTIDRLKSAIRIEIDKAIARRAKRLANRK